MTSKHQVQGICDNCGGGRSSGEDYPHLLFKWKGKNVCRFCLAQLKDAQKCKKKPTDEPAWKFNRMINKAIGDGMTGTSLTMYKDYLEMALNLNGAAAVDDSSYERSFTETDITMSEPGGKFNNSTSTIVLPASNVIFPSDTYYSYILWLRYQGNIDMGTNDTVFEAMRNTAKGYATRLFFQASDNTLYAQHRTSSGSEKVAVSTRAIMLNTVWHMIGVSYDAVKEKLLITYDRNMVTEAGGIDFAGFTSDAANLGYQENDDKYYYNGYVGELRCYSRYVPLTEIWNYYDSSKGTYGL